MIICCQCGNQMGVAQNGVSISFGKPEDYSLKIYRGDLLECDVCGNQVIGQFGQPYTQKTDEIQDMNNILFLNGD